MKPVPLPRYPGDGSMCSDVSTGSPLRPKDTKVRQVKPSDLSVLILCGGKGTRAYPHTLELPKPLLDVGGRPILWHIMGIYAQQGFRRFILAGGFKVERLEDFAADLPNEWETTVVDTGIETHTGDRILACKDLLSDRFLATYGDGLSDIDLHALLDAHRDYGGWATLTTVPLPSQYGTIEIAGDGAVVSFQEKPILQSHWINAGYFVFDSAAFGEWRGNDLEREVLPNLASTGHLYCYRHHGFWKSMDTYKDALELTDRASEGTAPWIRPSPVPSPTAHR